MDGEKVLKIQVNLVGIFQEQNGQGGLKRPGKLVPSNLICRRQICQSNVPVLIIRESSREVHVEQCYQYKIQQYIYQPVTHEVIGALVKSWILTAKVQVFNHKQLNFLILFVLYSTSITVPSKTYSSSYPQCYGEYRCQTENCSWQNDHFFCRQQYLKKRSIVYYAQKY